MADTTTNEPTMRTTIPMKLIDLGDGTFGTQVFTAGYKFQNITSNTTTVVKTGAGILKRLVFNKFVALGVVTIYDNTSAAGTVIGTSTLPVSLLASNGVLTYDISFATGLTIVTSVSFDLTVVYW